MIPSRSRATRPAGPRREGIILVVVLFFALLLATTVATFARKALIDHMIVQNRDARARAEALARGGVELATALLLEDKLRAEHSGSALDHGQEPWAMVAGHPIEIDETSRLEIHIEDAGARLNLNAAIAFDESGNVEQASQVLLQRLLEKAISELPLTPGERLAYDPVQLAAHLIDYVDEDGSSLLGGPEDAPYQERDPPALPRNQPLLSVDELRRVEGFDGPLVDALRPYVTVHPYVGGGGINPTTAPPHVLSLLFFNDGVDLRLAPEDTVREILRARQDESVLCGESSEEACMPMTEIVTNAIFPEPSFSSDVFIVTARARVGTVERRIEVVIDRSEGAEPLRLSWRVL